MQTALLVALLDLAAALVTSAPSSLVGGWAQLDGEGFLELHGDGVFGAHDVVYESCDGIGDGKWSADTARIEIQPCKGKPRVLRYRFWQGLLIVRNGNDRGIYWRSHPSGRACGAIDGPMVCAIGDYAPYEADLERRRRAAMTQLKAWIARRDKRRLQRIEAH